MFGVRKQLLIIGFILLIGIASAVMPTKVTITSSADSDSHNGWLVANGSDQTTITIKVENNSLILPPPTLEPVYLANVIVSIDPMYGSMTNTHLVTNLMGEATTVLWTNKTPTDTLMLNVTASNVEGQTSETKIIKIDHDQAYNAYFTYKDEVVVDQTTPFVITLKDRWGNTVDNKNPTKIHTVKFHIYPPPGGMGTGGLKNATTGYISAISDNTDSTGNISLTVKVDTVAGENNIWMERMESIPDKYPFIVGITQAPPYSISSVVTPMGDPGIPADTSSVFTIIYTIRDRFGNPSGNQSVSIFTSANESMGHLISNSMGQIWITYGPKAVTGEFNITAIAIENTTVHCFDIVKFYSSDPTSMVLTANPQMMPSRDVPGSEPAQIIAKVMDIMGNPVENETVSFTIPGYTNTTILTKRPSFSSSTFLATTSETTDVDGNAIVSFYAGEFPISGSKYSANATGTATIIATWEGNSMPITVTFKNYPYLRVETSVIPPVVNVSGTFDVDIKLIGDGWKLQSKDIDVFLVFDKSGSMGSDSPTRISQAKTATTTFIDQLTSRDLVGLVSFSSSTTTDKVLTNDFASVKTTINSLTASGSTQLRNAIYKAIDNLAVDGREGAVKAVIIMTDGNWNSHGTPLGHGTGWPSNNSDYTFSGSNLEPDNYRYYDGLGGTLTSYESCVLTGGCAVYSTTVCDNYANSCDTCAPGYTRNAGKCCNAAGTCKWPSQKPTWCSVKHCDEWACDVPQTSCVNKYKCTDGEFTEQNMSIYAQDKGVRLYTISFASTLDSDAVTGLQVMADSSGGFYQHAPTGADLQNIYLQIAGELRILAGVNTQMNLSFANVNVTYNNVTTSMEGKNVFNYIYQSGESTWVTSWNQTENPLPDQVPKPPTPPYTDVLPNSGSYTTYPYSFNQIDEWLSSSALQFNAGNITINQTWETKFRFRVNASGNIDIFGPGSKIIFNNGESELELPHTYISAVPNLTNMGVNATTLDISNLKTTNSGVIRDFISLEWQIRYDGNQTVTERISYSIDGGNTWVLFDTNLVTRDTIIDYSNLDIRLLPPGIYWIRVDASAPDAPNDREVIEGSGIIVGTAGRSYIKLE
jgi:hypothetical protein